MKNKILIIDPTSVGKEPALHSIHDIKEALEAKGFGIVHTESVEDGLLSFQKDQSLTAILLDWKSEGVVGEKEGNIQDILQYIRSKNDLIPVFLFTEKNKIMEVSPDLLEGVDGYIWKTEETPDFIAGRVIQNAHAYVDALLPPFFKKLRAHALSCKYSWHTPGHSNGIAFLKSPVGRLFYDFFGENIFRTDLSASVGELGSIFEHTGAKGEAEQHAADLFNADITYFVTGGTSAANRVIFSAHLKAGDLVVVDRNCHKSILHSLILTGAIPIYLTPKRNAYGIIGGIDQESFTKEHIQSCIQDSPLVDDKTKIPKMIVFTNSTYDGILYDVKTIREQLKGYIDVIHCDEAWIAYAHFHPFYEDRHAMSFDKDPSYPTMFSTQSSHKLLAAFSQASMIHVRQGAKPIDEEHLNQAFMMHSSTSPQYNIVASCDIAAQMMRGTMGKTLIEDTIEEALVFREKMEQITTELQQKEDPEKRWWFSIWEPKNISHRLRKHSWYLKEHDVWHGFSNIKDDFLLLDPLKVTILTPGLHNDGTMDDFGIPARVVSKFLASKGIIEEKTGFYNILTLFSLGITKGKSSVLISALFDFKEAFDENVPVKEALPDLYAQSPQHYSDMGLRDLCLSMHAHLKRTNIPQVIIEVYQGLPEEAMTPREAYEKYVEGEIEDVHIEELKGQIAANVLVPFPPGIPIIMPGERFLGKAEKMITYLLLLEEFSNTFPGFETEVHGVLTKKEGDSIRFFIRCVKEG